jgi:DNA modification methylase
MMNMPETPPSASLRKWEFPEGVIAQGDCLEWIPHLPLQSVRLIAIDPPFFTGKRQEGAGSSPASYSDSWIGGKAAYLEWLMERIAAMRELLLPDGSFVVHLDRHAVHAVKVALDDLFGEECFQNEIIWYYQTGGAGTTRFSRKHDSLLWYTRSDRWVFHPERIPVHRAPKALERARNPKGARISSSDTHKLPGDVLFVPSLNPMSKERTGYPTQKPLELMEIFIEALTEPGESVADFFCGSGTTVVAAAGLGRKWLACDISGDAVAAARKRLSSITAKSWLWDMPQEETDASR